MRQCDDKWLLDVDDKAKNVSSYFSTNNFFMFFTLQMSKISALFCIARLHERKIGGERERDTQKSKRERRENVRGRGGF